MEYNQRNNSSEDSNAITMQVLVQYLVRIMQRWWLIVVCAVVCACIGFGIAKLTYVPQYSCTMRFAVDNKSENTVIGGQTSSDINAGISLARNYQTIMTESTTLMKLISEDCGYDVTPAQVQNMIKSNLVEDTSIIAITITSPKKEVTEAVAVSYTKNYSKVTEEAYEFTRATAFDKPSDATLKPDNTAVTYAILGFVIGAALVVGIIVLQVFIKDTVKDPDDVSHKLNQTLIGSVVHMKGAYKKNILVTDKQTGFMFIEAFKLIRTKIENIARRKNYKVFMFSSAYENEGKTTIATNTALTLAKNGKSVLLIDADLRKPAVYKSLGISATNEMGLTGVIRGEKQLNESIKYFEKFNLFLLITSQPITDSSELLSTEEMENIIESVRNEFDYVIVDTPPGGVVTDASIIAQYADASIMVVRCDFAPSRKINKTIEDISNAGAELVGCIFNDADINSVSNVMRISRRKRGYGYGYGRGYGKGYGYGYGYGYGEHSKHSKDKK